MDSDSKLFTLPNPRAVVQTQSKTFRNIQDNISKFNDSARMNNSTIQRGPKYSGDSSPVMLLCPMCSGEVKRRSGTSKNRKIQIGFESILVPCYRCIVCGVHYSGHLPHIKCDDNPELEAEIIEYSGVR